MSLWENMVETCEDYHTQPEGKKGCPFCDLHFGRITEDQFYEIFEDW